MPFILSEILVQTQALTTEIVIGNPGTVETEFTESKCSEETVDEQVEGEDEQQVTMLQTLRKKEVVDLGNSNLHCLKLSDFSILETFTYTLLSPIVLVPLLSKTILKGLNNGTE